MSDTNTPSSRPASPAERLAAQIADITAKAKVEARIEIVPAEAELVEARDDLVRAEARLILAAATVREFQDLLGDVPLDDLVMTGDEVDSYNAEVDFDERVEPMVFGHSRNSNP